MRVGDMFFEQVIPPGEPRPAAKEGKRKKIRIRDKNIGKKDIK